jgi:hypothetical protein
VDSHNRRSYNGLEKISAFGDVGADRATLTKDLNAGKLDYGWAVYRNADGEGKWPMNSF